MDPSLAPPPTGRYLPPATCIEEDLARGEHLIRLSEVPRIPWLPRKKGKPLGKWVAYKWAARKDHPLETCGIQKLTTYGAIRRFFGVRPAEPEQKA